MIKDIHYCFMFAFIAWKYVIIQINAHSLSCLQSVKVTQAIFRYFFPNVLFITVNNAYNTFPFMVCWQKSKIWLSSETTKGC